jgi:putative transcriptional regulator
MEQEKLQKLSKIIKEKREEQHLSKTELALRIGRSPQLICDIESNRKGPSLDTLVAMASELKFSLDAFFLKNNYVDNVK